ncbi:MAG: ASKHA domain-containing protein [Coriobacteriales bacterium]|jgi:uncharacterized 2Fe-2S/4Fe-4S cluster protein (DUF4445 family)
MYTIEFKTEIGVEYKAFADAGRNLLEVAQEAGVDIDAPCGGNGKCGKCRAKIVSGTVETTPNMHLSKDDMDEGWRLLCQCTVLGDVIFWVPASAGTFKQGIRTADLSTPEELERYRRGIDAIFNAGIERGREEKGLGVAIDIGTTTVASVLMDIGTGEILSKTSMGNAQIRYGADVINRIISQGKKNGVHNLRSAVREETIIPMIGKMCREAGVSTEDVKYCCIAGNTTMEHLFVGEDASSIRLEPFVPAFLELHGKTASDLGLPFDPDAPVAFAPNVGSYVGGDITAGVLTSLMWNSEEMTLFIDLGTNGELVFGNADFMLCCACSAGPAFEGGDISCGMRATDGAIEACKIDEETMEPTFTTVNGKAPAGICGSGIIDIVAELFKCKIIGPNGKFIRDGDRVARSETSAKYILVSAKESATGSEIFINETDIDSFIKAKGAIFSAIRSMLGSLEMTIDCIEKIIIAGGIGSGINIENAISIGMLPKIPVDKFSYIGNSSLTGACAMLLSSAAEEKVFELGRNMTYIELSTHPGYMDEFVASCFIPHTDASLFE